MKLKKIMTILLSLALFSGIVIAKKSTTFLKDGNTLFEEITDMSSRNLRFEYSNGQKIHKNRIWMINLISKNWDFPNERSQLDKRFDTIFLKNNDVIYKRIVDFSSRRRVFEFKDRSSIHISKIKRIYICCTNFPSKYKEYTRNKPINNNKILFTTLLLNGTTIDTPLEYININKTGFTDGLQINTKDIYMLSFTDEKWEHYKEKKKVSKYLDSFFLIDGSIVHKNFINYNRKTGNFSFKNIRPIHINNIKRIYFHKRNLGKSKNRGLLRKFKNR